MTREFLLKASIAEFKDTKNNAEVYTFERFVTSTGYTYLKVDIESKKCISCAIHIDTEKDELYGIQEVAKGFLSTRVKINNNQFVKYKNFYLFINSNSEYNETMQQYGYRVDLLTNDKLRLLSEINEEFGNTCYDKVSTIPGYSIMPFYSYQGDFTQGVILFKIEESKSITMVRQHLKKLSQLREDKVSFQLVNLPRDKVFLFSRDLQEFSLSSNNFGIVSTLEIKDNEEYDKASQLKSLASSVETAISYTIEVEADSLSDRTIRHAFYEMKGGNNEFA